MPELDNVIKGLECHKIDINHRINCADCPYYVDDDNHIRCVNDLHEDALALLKEQEAEIEQLRNDANARRCKDCDNKECCGRAGYVVCGITGESHRPDWFCADFDPLSGGCYQRTL